MASTVLYVGSNPAPASHMLLRITLEDGRRFTASPGHPTAAHGSISELTLGDTIDGSTVTDVARIELRGSATFDIMPDGPSHLYWSDGVLLRSSLGASGE